MIRMILIALVVGLTILCGASIALYQYFGWKGLIAVPFVVLVVIWLIKKDQDPYAAEHAKEALNFSLPPTIAAVVVILRRDRVTTEEASRETPYAVATEGMKRCPSCGMGNLVTDDTCSSCGKRLPG